jgi:intracellular sulfur oxidation DsrE/DsrF family protein
MTKYLVRLLAAFLCVALVSCATVEEKPKERIVIQVSDAHAGTWGQALNVARNLQSAYGPGNAEIELVAFGSGIQMLKADAVVAKRVRDTEKAGVKIYACGNSMKRFKLKREDMVEGLTYVDARIEHIIKRYREGWFVDRP